MSNAALPAGTGSINTPADLDAAANVRQTRANQVSPLVAVQGVASMAGLTKILALHPQIKSAIDTVVASDDEALARDYLQMRGLHENASAAGIFSFPVVLWSVL